MSDATLRRLERSASTGDPSAMAALLNARVRSGELTRERLELAAFCGDEAARRACGWVRARMNRYLGFACDDRPHYADPEAIDEQAVKHPGLWLSSLVNRCSHSHELLVRVACFAGRAAQEAVGAHQDPKARAGADAALLAAETWADDQSVANRAAWDDAWEATTDDGGTRVVQWFPLPWVSLGNQMEDTRHVARRAANAFHGEQGPVNAAIRESLVRWALSPDEAPR